MSKKKNKAIKVCNCFHDKNFVKIDRVKDFYLIL